MGTVRIVCKTEELIYKDEKTGYCILRAYPDDIMSITGNTMDGYLYLVGYNLLYTEKDIPLAVEGEWDLDYKGRNIFVLKSYVLTSEAHRFTKAYLCTIDNVAEKTAEKILNAFPNLFYDIQKDDAVEKLIDEKVGRKKATNIIDQIISLINKPGIFDYVYSYGGNYDVANRLYERYGNASIDIIKKYPYKIGREIGMDFICYDRIALYNGYKHNSEERIIDYAVLALTEFAQQTGGTYMKYSYLLDLIYGKLNKHCDYEITKGIIQFAIEASSSFTIDVSTQRIGLTWIWDIESELAENILRFTKNRQDASFNDNLIDKVEKELNIKYSNEQAEAIKLLKDNRFSIITGGPGTGKSTVVKGILAAYKLMNPTGKIYLAAPTNKAAARLEEIVGEKATTIHRLLGYINGPGFEEYTYDRYRRLDGDLFIIDEASMIDDELFRNFLEAVEDSAKVIIVGDSNQLPPIGFGSMLKDMMNFSKSTNLIDLVELVLPFRSLGASSIITNSYEVLSGNSNLKKDSDFDIVITENLTDNVCSVAQYFHSMGMNFQVISPIKEYDGGVNDINAALQKVLNPNPMINFVNKGFKLGDRIVFTASNTEKEYFNGDTGTITKIDSKELFILTNKKEIRLTKSDVKNIELSYALTVHKSQGSEYDVVIISLPTSRITTRELLYTAITRAKCNVIIVTRDGSIMKAVNKTSWKNRSSILPKILDTKMK